MLIPVFLAGCMSDGFGLAEVQPDDIKTSAIAQSPTSPVDALRASDEATIRNAASSANLEAVGTGRVSWANPETGSRGEVSQLAEFRDKGLLCRRFRASRESYEGVALHKGEICMVQGGVWWTRSFAPA